MTPEMVASLQATWLPFTCFILVVIVVLATLFKGMRNQEERCEAKRVADRKAIRLKRYTLNKISTGEAVGEIFCLVGAGADGETLYWTQTLRFVGTLDPEQITDS